MIKARDYFNSAPIMQAGQARAQQYQNNGQLFGDLIKALSQIATQSIQKKQTNDLISQNPLFTTQETAPEQQVRYGNAPQIPTQQPFSATGNRSVVGVTDAPPIVSGATATFRTPTDRSGNYIKPMQPAPFANVATATIPAQTEQVLNRQGILNLLANPLTRQYALDSLGSTKMIEDMQPKREPFTLGVGQTRFDANGKPIASGGVKPQAPSYSTRNLTDAQGLPIQKRVGGITYNVKESYDRNSGKAIPNSQQLEKVDDESYKPSMYASGTPDDIKTLAQAIATYDGDINSIPRQDKTRVFAEARKINPKFSQITYSTNKKLKENYTSGKYSQNIVSLNTAIGHLGDLVTATNALKNGDIQALNVIANMYGKQTGTVPQDQFEAIRDAVANELATTFKGSSGTDIGLQNILKTMYQGQSPEQTIGVAQSFGKLLNSRLEALNSNYKKQTGVDFPVLDDEKKQILQSILGIGGKTINTSQGSYTVEEVK